MNQQLTVRELFDQVGERMKLRWLAGQRGENRSIQPGGQQSRRPSMAGYLNLIFPNKVQIIGTDELQYLDSLDPRHRWEMIEKIMNFRPAALVITKDQAPPADLHAAANETDTPLWVSSLRGHDLLTYLQYHMARTLAPTTTLHGVFMEVYSIGVLITGDAGSGKSELALELITRGHRLIADDAPEFTLIAPDVIDGTCPELLQDCLEVRGLGILNVREMFGDTAIKRNKYLRLVVHLQRVDGDINQQPIDRLRGDASSHEVLGVPVPMLTIPVAPGRNIAVLVEAAARNHILRLKGYDPAQTFIDRQAHQIRRHAP
jgi:HPr kinase/phosphorylase